MHHRSFFDETFDPYQTSGAILLVEVGKEECSIAILDATRKHFVGLVTCEIPSEKNGRWHQLVSDLHEEYPWLSHPFKRVALSLRSPVFTLLPSAYFDPNYAKLLLERIAFVDDLDEIHFQEVASGIMGLFTAPAPVLNAWRTVQPHIKVCHQNMVLTQANLSSSAHQAPTLHIHLKEEFAVITLTVSGKLRSCIPLRARAASDLLYHATALCQAQGLDPNRTHFRVMGEGLRWPSPSDPLREEGFTKGEVEGALESFFPPAEGRITLSGYTYSYLLQRFEQSHLSLFALALCV